MRLFSLIIFTFLVTTATAQNVPFSKEELKKFRKFEGIQVSFMYDELIGDYTYKTQTLKQLSTSLTNAQINLHTFIKLVKKDDEYCFSDVHVAFSLLSQGKGRKYNRIEALIGFATNIRKGDAIKYEFEVISNLVGYSTISGEKINEIITKSREMKRPITFKFYNEDKQVSSMTIAYAKVNQKLGGIIDTQVNLTKKHIRCAK